MSNISKFDQETKGYFDTLPITVQENIVQSNLEFSNREELEQFANNLMNRK